MPYIERNAEQLVRQALQDMRVVVISGPRQSGKSTLALRMADSSWDYLTLDDQYNFDMARKDPIGLLSRAQKPVIIDEIQRVPDLLLTVKMMVDRQPVPGQFLLTGSANLLTIPRVSESLAGRAETIPLLPFSQSELRGVESKFLDLAFQGEAPEATESIEDDALISMVLRGGFLEAADKPDIKRTQAWCRTYLDAMVQRDIQDIADIRKATKMPRMLEALASHSGRLLNQSTIGQFAELDNKTLDTYISAFEQLYLINHLPAWHNNRLKRLVKKPKLHFVDTALLASLLKVTPESLARDRTDLGPLLETFVFDELKKLITWHESTVYLSHYRDKDQVEVDFILEGVKSQIVGVEVKASATVNRKDFNGLRKLAAAAGDRFRLGIVLYTGERILPHGPGLFAMPVSALWSPS